MANIQCALLFGTIALALIATVYPQIITLKDFLNTISSSATSASPQMGNLITGPVYTDRLPTLTISTLNIPVVQRGNIIIAKPRHTGSDGGTDTGGGSNGGHTGSGGNSGGNSGGGNTSGGGNIGGGNTGGGGSSPYYRDSLMNFVDGIARIWALRKLHCRSISDLYGIHFPLSCSYHCHYGFRCLPSDPSRPHSYGFCCPFYVNEYTVYYQTMMSRYDVIGEYFTS